MSNLQLKNTFLLIFFCLGFAMSNAQDNRLHFRSIGLGVGSATTSSAEAKTGLNLNIDLVTNVNRHLFSFYLNLGLKLNTIEPKESFGELNLTYGRTLALSSHWNLEGHAGAGLFIYDHAYSSNYFGNVPEAALGFPVRLKLIYKPTEHIGLGINPNVNFNTLYNTYSASFLVQYHFK